MSASFRKLCLYSAAIALISIPVSAPVAFAQDDTEARQETIRVTASPIRDSQAAAIETKRDADNIIDVIAADTIGRFPDQTLAQALTRVPGLAVESDQGEARFVNFRGGRFRYTTISFDGIDVLGADNGRIPRFDSIPAVITSSVEATKAVTPDTPGAPVLGHININTYSPFDTEGFGLSATVAAGQRTLNDGDLSRYALRVSHSGDEFGILAFGTLDSRDRFVDNREYEINAAGTGVDNLDFRQYGGVRENYSYGGKFELRPNDSLVERVFGTSIFYEFVDDEERNQFDFDFPTGSLTYGTGGSTIAVPSRLLEHGRYETSTATTTIGADMNIGEWFVSPRLNYTETNNFTSIPLIQSVWFSPLSARYNLIDINDPLLYLYDLGTTNPADINTSGDLDIFINVYYNTDTTSTKGLIDFERDLTLFGRDTVFSTGFGYDMREAEGGNTTAVQVGGLPIDPGSYASGTLWNSDFTNSIRGVYYDNVSMGNDLIAGLRAADPNFSLYPEFDPEEVFMIDEDIFSAYAMATTDFSWGNIVYGLRLEHTDFSTAGSQVLAGVVTDIDASNDYTNILPSIHVNYDLNDDMKLRLSATTGLSRPTYSEARASQSVSPTTNSISGGNPYLDPETSIGLDASFEWYFDQGSIFSVGAFYRSIDNVIYPGSEVVDPNVYAPGVVFTGSGPITLNSFLNGDDGELSGLEINYIGTFDDILPIDGFGATGNVTLLDSEFYAPSLGITAPIPGTSDLIYNASLFYENNGLSARVSYQWRDAWLSTTESGPSLNQYWDETERLDAKVQYQLPFDFRGASATIFAEGNNLSDANDRRYINTPATIDQNEGYGQSYMIGLSVDY